MATVGLKANDLARSILQSKARKSSPGKYVARMTPKQLSYLLSLAEADQQRRNTPLQGDHARGQCHANLSGQDRQFGDVHNPAYAWHTAGLNLWAEEVKP